jgi:hypothetical protein
MARRSEARGDAGEDSDIRQLNEMFSVGWQAGLRSVHAAAKKKQRKAAWKSFQAMYLARSSGNGKN